MTKIDPTWLEAFDKELLQLFAIDHSDAAWMSTCWAATQTFHRRGGAGVRQRLRPERDDALWPRPGTPV